MVIAAAASNMIVRGLFRDEAVLKVTKAEANCVNLSPGFAEQEPQVIERLHDAGLDDLDKLVREAKSVGDVRLWACSSSVAVAGVSEEDLIESLDGIRGLTTFLLKEIAEADQVLTF